MNQAKKPGEPHERALPEGAGPTEEMSRALVEVYRHLELENQVNALAREAGLLTGLEVALTFAPNHHPIHHAFNVIQRIPILFHNRCR